ncbi:hypothetical protein ACPW7J_13380 [Ihubacter sp. rT4E-8]|uniref:hypothetical protein n=1 Tax=Ihubacter sp. rT4E-8 TaxID=3242369 RepID=UPI001379C629
MKDNERDESIYDEMLKARIQQALRNQYNKESLDPQTLAAWVENDRMKRKNRRRGFVLAACCIVLVFVSVMSLRTVLFSDSQVSVAKKGDTQIHKTDDGAIVKNNDGSIDENMGNVEVIIEDWDQITEVGKEHPKMVIPEYVPDGYVFRKLIIMSNQLTEKFQWVFANGEEEIEIMQSVDMDQTFIFDYGETIELEWTTLLLNMKDRIAYCEIEEIKIIIRGVENREDYIEITEGMRDVCDISQK